MQGVMIAFGVALAFLDELVDFAFVNRFTESDHRAILPYGDGHVAYSSQV